MQVEYATDLVFHKQDVLRPLYEALARTAIHAVKCEQVATFLGHRLTESYEGEIGNDFSTRLEGTRIKHYMGPAAIKMYDKFALVLRVETTCNDVTFFKHHRRVEHRDGTWEMKLAPMKKSIYSLIDLRQILLGCNRRYLQFLSALEDTSSGQRDLMRLTEPQREGERTIKGLNFFAPAERACCTHCNVPSSTSMGCVAPTSSRSSPSATIRICRVSCIACVPSA